jgi:hypothetical protein
MLLHKLRLLPLSSTRKLGFMNAVHVKQIEKRNLDLLWAYQNSLVYVISDSTFWHTVIDLKHNYCRYFHDVHVMISHMECEHVKNLISF